MPELGRYVEMPADPRASNVNDVRIAPARLEYLSDACVRVRLVFVACDVRNRRWPRKKIAFVVSQRLADGWAWTCGLLVARAYPGFVRRLQVGA